ncbi:hypothetical protein M3Y99_01440100 [Aphelenchoides fujianensis]|nr:hypothetical protein M3Y99_01440100 [Aphelenchoides fujianensis]
MAEQEAAARVQWMRPRLVKLGALADSLDVAAVYAKTKRFQFVNHPENIETIRWFDELFLAVPASRDALLAVLEAMCHESIYLHFLRLSGQFRDQNNLKLEQEVTKFLRSFPSLLSELNSTDVSVRLLEWSFAVCAKISDYNSAQLSKKLARKRLPLLLQVECIGALVALIEGNLESLFETSLEDVIRTTVDAFKYDVNFDWILLHLVEKYPSKLISRLMEVCVEEMREKATAIVEGRPPARCQNLAVVSDLVLFLATQKVPELRTVLVDHIAGFFEGRRSMYSLLTVANMLLATPTVASVLTNDVQQMVTNRNLTTLVRLTAQPEWRAAMTTANEGELFDHVESTRVMLTHMPLDSLVELYLKLMPMATSSENDEMKAEAEAVIAERLGGMMEVIFAVLYQRVVYGTRRKLLEVPHLYDLIINSAKRQLMLEEILDGGKCGEYATKLMTCCGVYAGGDLLIQLMAEMLYLVGNERQLKNLVAFIRVMTNQVPHFLTYSVGYLLQNLQRIAKRHDKPEDVCSLKRLCFLEAIVNFVKWHEGNTRPNVIISCGLNFSLIDGFVQLAALDTLTANLADLAATTGEQRVLEFVEKWLDLVEEILPADFRRFDLSLLQRFVDGFPTAGVLLVRQVTKLKDVSGEKKAEISKRFFDYARHFFRRGLTDFRDNEGLREMHETAVALNVCFVNRFFVQLLQVVLDHSHDLFGTPPEVFATATGASFEDFPLHLLPPACRPERVQQRRPTILERLRRTEFTQRRTAALAHSGVISSQHAKYKQQPWTEVERLRAEILFGALADFLDDLPAERTNEKPKLVANFCRKLVQVLCPNALSSTICWLEWPVEQTNVALYVEIVQRIHALRLIPDLMLWLAPNGFLALCHLLPVLKAMFAVIVNTHGATPMKSSRLTAAQLERIAELFSILIAGGVFPPDFKSLLRLLAIVNHHEAFTVLRALWEYIQMIVPQSQSELEALERGEKTPADFLRKANPKLLQPIVVPLMSAHLDALGKSMAAFLAEEAYEDGEENEGWT